MAATKAISRPIIATADNCDCRFFHKTTFLSSPIRSLDRSFYESILNTTSQKLKDT